MTPAPGRAPAAARRLPEMGPGGARKRGPGGGTADEGCETGRMPVLDPNPQNGQKKLLLVLGAMLAITVIIGIIASVASP